MNDTHPLLPITGPDDAALRRLSGEIGVLTDLMDDCERTDHDYMDGLFARARAAKVGQAQALIARLAADGAEDGLPAVSASLALPNGEQFLTVTGLGKRARQPEAVVVHAPFIIYCEETPGGCELRLFEEGAFLASHGAGGERRFLLVGHAATAEGTAGQLQRWRERFRPAPRALPGASGGGLAEA